MSDFNYGGTDEESAEIKRLNNEVLENTDNFESWEKLVRAAESLEGGLNRNSSPQAIATIRDAYDRFLAKFPLLFGYWKKYADLEFSIAGTEAAEMVFERGIASITISVDLWTDYCSFKVETSHDPDVIRELYERGASSVGLDFLAHPFWDKYLEFEDRLDAEDRIFAILKRVINIPMHQYARYFERFRGLAHRRPLPELVPAETLATFRAEVEAEAYQTGPKGEQEIERELRSKVDTFYLDVFTRTQTETTKRWTYESEVKRPYFHVTELDHAQLANWRKYLDFEESEGDYTRTIFLYERCLVTCAFYDEFWFRYARWMSAKEGKQEEVRNIYQRASTLYVPISRPGIRLQYAYFEEMSERYDVAKDIHEAILDRIPGHVETIVSWANLERRQNGLEAAIEVYKNQIDTPVVDLFAKAAFVVEWAILLWKIQGSVDEARQVFQKNQQWYLLSRHFWAKYFEFEISQPTSLATESEHYERIKKVHSDMIQQSRMALATKKDLSNYYLTYLQQRGTKEAMKEFLQVDRELNGPSSIQPVNLKIEGGKGLENGHGAGEVDEAILRKGEVQYSTYFQQHGETLPPTAAGLASFH
ncbi:Pre-mRNA-processing factor [Lachnellula hyalina]|uniref:Pre-mRNA-processing factor n=1 Tax=Lachnellula hyalina TaxID=1316788 RepID=A0A8H8R3X9_9HELO|nr:Pre-mRNA-processing factor [Lachnellula hyalina]TVY28063.1 Pre-mRNA-processing factor [Lachnellula hyalina]